MAAYSLLITVGFFILLRRDIYWSELIHRNRALFMLLFYMALSVMWSDSPFVSFKRYVKTVGMILMALIILTEQDPVESMQTAIKRCAYLLIPLSLLFVKYYPHLGVSYDQWFGMRMINGVTGNKNMLGQLCLVIGLVFVWILFTGIRKQDVQHYKIQTLINIFIFALTLYLLKKSNSQTAIVCFIIGTILLIGQGLRFVQMKVGVYIVIMGIILALLEWSIGISKSFLNILGRDPTLTYRTEIWHELLPMAPSMWFGAGHEFFWEGERLRMILETRNINEAHNGFLEIYLNLGLIGVSLYLLVIMKAYRNCIQFLKSNFNFGRFAYSAFIVVLMYSITEAAFRGLGLIPFTFYIIAVDVQNCSLSEKTT